MATQQQVNDLQPTRSAPLFTWSAWLSGVLSVDAERLAYLVLLAAAILSRFWDLGVRVMSHDESLHTRFSWGLFMGDGFQHTPLMHGPLLFHMTALNYLLLGDNDFTSRIYPALIGVLVVMSPLLMRKWLGRAGALAASGLFLISPMILYYSRYIRHDLPAILGALIMMITIWRYMETRKFENLLWHSFGFAVLFASKEVSFIYVAIFGSFMTVFFLARMLQVPWRSTTLYRVFVGSLAALLIGLAGLGGVALYESSAPLEALDPTTTVAPPDPNLASEVVEPAGGGLDLSTPMMIAAGVVGLALLGVAAAGLIGQAGSLRRFPEFDLAMVMGTLVLSKLTPFLILAAGFNPLDESSQGIATSAAFTVPVLLISFALGLWHFMEPPQPRYAESVDAEGNPTTVEIPPDAVDWLMAFFSSRWWMIGGIYWVFSLFFFTTMFTNAGGVGSGVVGSLGYWLEQQEVKRGNQPWYYYLLITTPIYEFLPLILTMAAGVLGLVGLLPRASHTADSPEQPEPSGGDSEDTSVENPEAVAPSRPLIDLDAPVSFPVLGFLGYLTVMNFIAYSLAGEKMPWLTTHLTTPMILIGGWVLGRAIERFDFAALWERAAWPMLVILPVLAIALLRSLAPACTLWPQALMCNTIMPLQFIDRAMETRSVEGLQALGEWIGAVVVLAALMAIFISLLKRVDLAWVGRLAVLFVVGWLVFLTARTSWRAAYIAYDDATEFLVYAHSAGSVKDVMDQIEELSMRTTGGDEIRVAYDNLVSWPMSWYFRDYPNAVYYGEQPSRGLLGDASVIIAGPGNNLKVESLIGDRYYRFDYVRMWWPMQDYFGYEDPSALAGVFGDLLQDPALQRGLWEIFYNRDFEPYADAVTPYRAGQRPDFGLENWPVSQRMYVYIRKDQFAQVWDYGVTASEIAESFDPYAAGQRVVQPSATFMQSQLNRPHGIDIGPDGLIYVADSNNHRIVVMSPDGVIQRQIGGYGLAPAEGGLNEPWDVGVGPDGTVYVADTWNYQVVAFDAQGQWIRSWGVPGPNLLDDPFALWGPRGIEVDEEGRVYVADTGNKRILVYSADGDFIRQIGSGGGLDGQLDEPAGLAIGPDGALYVADTWNQRVQVFSAEGVFLRNWALDGWFAQTNERPYLVVDGAGNVYVGDPEAFRVIVFDSFGNFQYTFGDFTTVQTVGGLAVSDQGVLYLSDVAGGVVQAYTDLQIPATGQ